MAKRNNNESDEMQIDLFPVEPEIRGLAISQFKLKDGAVEATLNGATLVNDVALIDHEVWRKAIAEWLVALCANGDHVQTYLDEARSRAYAAERDRELMREAMDRASRSNVTSIGVSALA